MGYLHTDRCAGNHDLSGDIGCWTHARRKRGEALNAISVNDRFSSKAMKGKHYCDALFTAEDRLDKEPLLEDARERTVRRRELAEPILAKFREWLTNIHPVPRSALGRAVAYIAGAVALSVKLPAERAA